MSPPVFVFGGNPVQPGDATYIAYVGGQNWTLGEALELFWPFSFTSTGNPVRTTMTFQTTDSPGVVRLPNATEASPGESFIMWNIGATNIEVTTFSGATVINNIPETIAYWTLLIDNSTEDGDWLVLQYGAGISGGTAATLAGYGLIPLPNPPGPQTLNVDFRTELKTSPFTLTLFDWASTMVCRSVCDTITLPALSNVEINADGFFCFIYNNTGTPINLHPVDGTILINNSNNDLSILPGFSCMLQFDGVFSYTTIGLETQTGAVTSLFDVDISAGQTYKQLTEAQLANQILVLRTVGTPLTNDVTIYFSDFNNEWIVHNLTLSPYNIILQGGSLASPVGSSYVLPNGSATTFYVNASAASLYTVDQLPPVPNSGDLIPLSTAVAGTTYGGARWGGVAIIENSFSFFTAPIVINTTEIILNEASLSGTIVGNVVIEGVVYISPAATPPNNTYITIQKRVDGGGYQNISTQGAVPVFECDGNAYANTELVPAPFKVIDQISPAETNVIYYVLGNVTGGTAQANAAQSGTIVGISRMFVTLYGASSF